MTRQPRDFANGRLHSLIDAALEYHCRGWCVIPVIGKKSPPRMRWKRYQAARPDEATLRQLFARSGITGMAVILGSVSGGLACRDFDTMEGYDRWARDHVGLAKTLPTVQTARGRHVYFRGPELFHDFGDGEYRGDAKHYTLLPPSRHPDGPIYTWIIGLPKVDLPAIDPYAAGILPCEAEQTAPYAAGLLPLETEQTEQPEMNRANREDRGELSKQMHTDAMGEGVGGGKSELEDAVEAAITATLPTGRGRRNRRLFDLARELKAIPKLADAALSTLRPIVERWFNRALLVIGTRDFLETWSDFIQAWKKVRFAAGQGVVEQAFQRAAKAEPPKRAVKLYQQGPIVLLASLCRELQRVAAPHEFFLDCRTAGRLLKIPHPTAWRWLNILCADEIITTGEKGSHANHKATRYRFIAD